MGAGFGNVINTTTTAAGAAGGGGFLSGIGGALGKVAGP